MKLENFLSEALCQPSDYTAYYISRRLTELYPEKAIVEGEFTALDLNAYAKAGLCSTVAASNLHNQTQTFWRGVGDFTEYLANGWANVLWRGELIDVVFATISDCGCKSRKLWVLAESKEIAEKFINEICEWCNEVRSEILVFDAGYWYKDEDLFKAIKGATFDNLILPPALKREIQEDFARFFASREIYDRYGIPWKRGVLLIGPPGNGKTHTVKALLNELQQACLYVRSFKSHYGTEQENMKMVFERARKVTPCLLVMEDLDSLVDDSNRSFLLNELDGFAANTGVVVIATTNHPEKLDPAILDRPSRFDRKYYFVLPATAERKAYVESWNRTLQPEMRLANASIVNLAEQTEGFSFAYLKELFLSSMMQWIAEPAEGAMDKVVIERAGALRDQMKLQADHSATSALARN